MEALIRKNKRQTVWLIFLMLVILAVTALVPGLLLEAWDISIPVAAVALVYLTVLYLTSSRMATRFHKAHRLERSDNPRVYRIVENLALTAGIPTPEIYQIDDPAANAFAVGIKPSQGRVAITRGLLEILDDNELQAVMAHEISHIANYDTRVNCLLFSIMATMGLVVDMVWRSFLYSGTSRRRSSNSNAGPAILIMLAIVAGSYIALLAMKLLALASSRQREYLADTSGVQLTRYPEGLIGALEKIRHRGTSLQKPKTGASHMFFAQPLKSNQYFLKFFSSHPPIEDRINQLKSLTARGL